MKRLLLLAILLITNFISNAQCVLLANATPGITLVHQNTNCFNNSGVAFNPNLGLYYGVRAGNSAFPLETWTATGVPLYQTSAGFDWRGMWWNPTTNQLEGNGYSTSGIWKADLNGSGYALNTGTTIFSGMNQPDAQSCGDLDWQAYEILYYFNGTIYRYSRTTNALLGSYPITGTPVAISNLNSTTLMYTGCPGKEIALLDYVNKRVYVYNKANGAYAGMSQLPVSAVTTTSFRTSWANCYVWLFNVADFTWYSYKIFDQCSACAPVYTTNNFSICNGDSIQINGVWHSTSGAYNDTLLAANGCDSIIVNNLTVQAAITTNVNVSICNGDSLFVGGAWQHNNGNYHDTLNSSGGCDSVIISHLTVIAIPTVNLNVHICSGDSMFVGGSWQHIAGTYYDTLTASTGCDSIVISHLTVIVPVIKNKNQSICSGDSLFVGGAWQHAAGNYIDTFSTSLGCDSIVFTHLNINPIYFNSYFKSICQGDSIFLAGFWRSTPGVYNETLIASTGCDSTNSTTLSVNPLPTVNLGNDKTLCEGQSVVLNASTTNASYLWQNNSSNATLTATQSGLYWVEVTSNNCSSRDSIQLTFNPVPVVDLGPDQSLCPDDKATLDVTLANATYVWQDHTTKPVYVVMSGGVYWVKVTLQNCFSSDSVKIDFNKPNCNCSVFIPNAFSPNNDFKNDEIGLVDSRGIDLKEFRIFNRWGEEVFKSQSLFDKWNGNYKGAPAETGTYYYVVRYICNYNGKENYLKGDIILVR